MSAPRNTSLRTLSRFSKQVRQLHITGPATFPSPLITSERPAAAALHRTRENLAKRPRLEADESATNAPSRYFNTSRELKAVNDSSTIDFAYLPAFDPDSDVTAANVRVPIIGAWGRSQYVEAEEPDVSLSSPISNRKFNSVRSVSNCQFCFRSCCRRSQPRPSATHTSRR